VGDMSGDLESVVYCPFCGNEICMGLEKISSELMNILLGSDAKQNHYSADETKCPSCGVSLMVTLTVTGMKK
jgi:predicted RNA-binding Zn-ribbon protein involved in translation (DUF1610 family)